LYHSPTNDPYYLEECVELEHLGLNLITFTLILTLCCTTAEAFGLRQQRKAIWEEQSGASVSVSLFCYMTCIYFVTALYGISVNSVALMVDGTILSLSCVPILIGLWKFKGFTGREKAVGLACLAVPFIMHWSPRKDIVYLALCLFNIVPILAQIWEMWRERSSGVVSISFLWTVFATLSVWSVYGFVFGDWAMQVAYPSILAVIVLAIVTWYRFREPDPKAA